MKTVAPPSPRLESRLGMSICGSLVILSLDPMKTGFSESELEPGTCSPRVSRALRSCGVLGGNILHVIGNLPF